ncbi:MAG: endonuclease Q family protein, partial [Methanoregula sp.]|nr:endonuclease Q family protein [Methanoregula sp.]
IKKGVSDRAKELSGAGEARPRPPYVHVLPLAQIIQTMEGASSPNTKKCRAVYASFIQAFGNEIAVLIDVPIAEIRTVHPKAADVIAALRDGTVVLHPGGGGKYGTFSLSRGA